MYRSLMAASILFLAVQSTAQAAAKVSLLFPKLTNTYIGSTDSGYAESSLLTGTTGIVGQNGMSSSDMAAGFMKARAEAWEFKNTGRFYMGYELDVRNSSFFEDILIPPGAITFNLDAKFLIQKGAFGTGEIYIEAGANFLAYVLGAWGERVEGSVGYRRSSHAEVSSDYINYGAHGAPYTKVSDSLSPDSFTVSFSNSKEFLLPAGDILTISADIFVDAHMSLVDSPVGYYALMDMGNTAQLGLQLPSNVTIANAPPGLTWITVVPEPGTVPMLIAGLAMVGWLGSNRTQWVKHSAARRPLDRSP